MKINNICCIGAGYVGGPTMTVLADKCPNLKVNVVDTNKKRIALWNNKDLSKLPIYEPGLSEIIGRARGKNLFFTSDVDESLKNADMVFISVNTPIKKKGIGAGQACDLRWVEASARQIARCCKGKTIVVEKLKVYGDDWETLDGSGVRDYIHVMDLAEGHIRALDFIIEKRKKVFIVLNLGTGFGTSVFEMIETFERVNDLKIDYEVVNRRICDSAQIFADCKKAREILGWTPKRTLEDICRDGWKWQKDNPNGYDLLD
jgi:hypothetical protein